MFLVIINSSSTRIWQIRAMKSIVTRLLRQNAVCRIWKIRLQKSFTYSFN